MNRNAHATVDVFFMPTFYHNSGARHLPDGIGRGLLALSPPPRHAGIPLSPRPPFPLVRSTDRKSLVRAPTVLVLSTIHPSFQPILNLNQIDPRPFPHPSNNHAPTTSQPSFGSNTRTTRFRLNLPTSLIRHLQPILKNNSTSTKKLAQDRPFRVLCMRSEV